MKFIALLLFLLTLCCAEAHAQLSVAFYNVENLFDTLDDPHKRDNEFLPASRKQWTGEKYKHKLMQLSRVVRTMNDSNGPDILGLCELENRAVLEDWTRTPGMAKLDFAIVHQESKDLRGIDVALFYRKSRFKKLWDTALVVPLPDSMTAIRDILFVAGVTAEKDTLGIFVAHFPSKVGGEEKAKPKRDAAAHALRSFAEEMSNKKHIRNLVILGDFNEGPSSEAIKELLGACDPDSADQCFLLNIFSANEKLGKGSYCYRDRWEQLDQAMVSSSLFYGNAGLKIVPGSATVLEKPWLLQHAGKYKGYPNRSWSGNKYQGGYSDHLPIMLNIVKVK